MATVERPINCPLLGLNRNYGILAGVRDRAKGKGMFVHVGAGECALVIVLLLVVIGSVFISIRLRNRR